VVGGALVDSVGWPAVFLVNVPIGLAAIVLTARYVPESRAIHARRLDPIGQVLVIVALATLTYAIIEGPGDGWLSAPTLIEFAIAVLAFALLIAHELRREQPLIEIRFFSSAPFSGASMIAICAFAALGGFLFLNTLYLQDVRGLSPFHAGLYLLPMAAVTLVVAPISGRLVGSHGSRLPLVVGSLALMASAALLTGLSPVTPVAQLFGSYFLFGLGFGLMNPPITNTAVSGMPPSQAGVAAAVASTSRQVGATLGVAVLGAVAGATATAGGLGRSFAAATHSGWWIILVLGLVILIVALVTTTGWAQQTARRTAERFREEPEGDATNAASAGDRAELVTT